MDKSSGRVIVYGQAPSRTSDPARPLSGTSGRRLARLAGLAFYEELAATFDLRNLLTSWPGSNGKGDRFPIAGARSRATEERETWQNGDRVVLLGREVGRAFGVIAPYLTYRALNDTGMRERVANLLSTLALQAKREVAR